MPRFRVISSVRRFGNALPATVVLQQRLTNVSRWPTGKVVDLLGPDWMAWIYRANFYQPWMKKFTTFEDRNAVCQQIWAWICHMSGGPSQGVNDNGLLRLNRVTYLGQVVSGVDVGAGWVRVFGWPISRIPPDPKEDWYLDNANIKPYFPTVSYCDWTGTKLRTIGKPESRDHVIVPLIGGGYLPRRILEQA